MARLPMAGEAPRTVWTVSQSVWQHWTLPSLYIRISKRSHPFQNGGGFAKGDALFKIVGGIIGGPGP